MIDHAPFDDLLRIPFETGGRIEGGTIDCLGITLEMARRRGVPLQDPWQRVGDLHRNALPVDHLFSPGWHRAEGTPCDDDVALLVGDELGVGWVLGGMLYTASKKRGVHRLPITRHSIQELWRWSQ